MKVLPSFYFNKSGQWNLLFTEDQLVSIGENQLVEFDAPERQI